LFYKILKKIIINKDINNDVNVVDIFFIAILENIMIIKIKNFC